MKTNRLLILLTRLVFLALLGVTTVLVLSCERSPVDVAPSGSNIRLLGTSLLTCTPLTPDSATQAIGPDGGTIQVGPHTFTVPAGALDTTVSITAVVPADTVNRIVFEPSGLVFNQPASLTMSYANCQPSLLPLPRVIAHVDDGLNILDLLKSVGNPPSQTVTAQVPHFSDYAVAW